MKNLVKIKIKIIHLFKYFSSWSVKIKQKPHKNIIGFSETEKQTTPFAINLLHTQHFFPIFKRQKKAGRKEKNSNKYQKYKITLRNKAPYIFSYGKQINIRCGYSSECKDHDLSQ